MDIRHFRYVTALAQEMNFSAAAKRLHIAQPALSQNIRQVEEELGVKLFERSTRKVALTDAGRAFYREAHMILAKVENAKRTALRAASGEIGSLAIGFTTTSILGGELTRRLRVFQQRYPDIRITLEDYTVNKLMNRLRTSAIDVACTEGIYPDDSLETQALKPLPVVLAFYKGHPLAKRRHLRLSMLAKEHFILPRTVSGLGGLRSIRAVLRASRIQARPRLITPQMLSQRLGWPPPISAWRCCTSFLSFIVPRSSFAG